jgi:ribosome maturation factor RimP
MNLLYSHALTCAVLMVILEQADGFSTHPSFTRRVKGYRSSSSSSNALYAAKDGGRSRVSDPTGPTPQFEEIEPETVSLQDQPEFHFDPDKHVANQPWRRGETNGCEDPIDAAWRVRAEQIIKTAVYMVGGKVIDVTWFLTSCLVTIRPEKLSLGMDIDLGGATGPTIDIRKATGPIYKDPDDPNPEVIWSDRQHEPVYERDEQAEFDLKRQMYARKAEDEEDLDLGDDEDVPLYTAQETRGDDQLRVKEEMEEQAKNGERPVTSQSFSMDTTKLSNIAGAILDALEFEEKELRVIARHKLVLTSPGNRYIMETQSEFDKHRGHEVVVETQDPWDSNRTLRGKLVDRNSMDVIINQKGRMVTIPNNFVRVVRLKNVILTESANRGRKKGKAKKGAKAKKERIIEPDDDLEVEYEDGEIDYEE